MSASEAWAAVTQVTSDPHERGAFMVGAALESSCQNVYQQGGGPGVGMWQVEAAEGGSHYGEITIADAMNPLTAARFMLPDYRAACRDIGDGDWASDPMHACAEAAFRAERPAQMYPESRIQAAWQLVSPFIVGSSTGGIRVVTNGVYGEDLIAKLETQIGHERSGTFDTVNGDHVWAYYCLAGVQAAAIACGLSYPLRPSALAKYQVAFDQGLIQTGTPEHGAQVFFGTAFYAPDGHTGLWNADRGQLLGTLTDGTGVGYRPWGPGTVGYLGYMRVPGVIAPRRPVVTPPVVAAPPVVTPQTVFTIDASPYGPVPILAPFWSRWDALNTMGAKLDHPGTVNPKGLALPQIGYAMEPERTVNGRRVQRFERGWLATGDGPEPFDVVVLTDSDRAALIAPQPAPAPAAPASGTPTGQPARH